MPLIVFALVAAGITYWAVRKYKPALLPPALGGGPAPLPPGPSPAPAPPSPTPSPPAPSSTVILKPGTMTLTLAAEAGFTLTLPPGARWAPPAPGVSPVVQGPNSVLNGTLTPAVPTGSQSQVWSNVGGTGVLQMGWVDASGAPQATTLTVSTTGSAHTLGYWMGDATIMDHMIGSKGRHIPSML